MAGAFVPQGAVDGDKRCRAAQLADPSCRSDAHQQAAAGAKQLFGHEDRIRRTNGATDHTDTNTVPLQREHFRMVTSPVRVFLCPLNP